MERGGEVDEESYPVGGASAAAHRRGPAAPPHAWPTVDGQLGLETEDRAVEYARSFFFWGFFCLPWLWAVNCLYFWPALRGRPAGSPSSSPPFSRLRPYVVRSAIGFLVFTVLLASWALTFAIGGEHLFGPVWGNLVMYNVADRLGLTGWS